MASFKWPLKDIQQDPPDGHCDRCGEGLQGESAEPDERGHVFCFVCREALEHTAQEARWLEARKRGLGASDAACILGLNPWKNNIQLWEEKTGRTQAPDISGKDVVRYGKEAEKHLRELFALDFPQYEVSYDEFGMESQPERPWLFATLDGTLTEYEDEQPYPLILREGILEIKTTEIQRAADWDKWDNKVPDHYYPQILHQLLATGYNFAVLKAQIKWHKGGALQITTRHYWFEREDCREDLQHLLEKETAFWSCVINDTRPAAMPLPGI